MYTRLFRVTCLNVDCAEYSWLRRIKRCRNGQKRRTRILSLFNQLIQLIGNNELISLDIYQTNQVLEPYELKLLTEKVDFHR